MLKPSDIDTTPSAEDESDCARLEARVDDELRRSHGRYPVPIPLRRDGLSLAVVRDVARRYHNAGWLVTMADSGSGFLFSLQPREAAAESDITMATLTARLARLEGTVRRVCPPDMAAEILGGE